MEAVATGRILKSSGMQMLASFRMGESELALSISSLQEVVSFPEKVTKVPLAPEYLTGLFNLRGIVVPIVDMAVLLGMESKADPANKKVAIISVENVRIGLLFDMTSEILNVSADDISMFETPPSGKKMVIRGVIKLNDGDRIVEVIDPLLLLKIENIPQILAQTKNNLFEISQKKSKRAQCITFRSGNMEFAVRISAITEIIKVPEIKKSVLAVDYCIGMVNLRGALFPLLDFKKFLKIQDSETETDKMRVVILKLQDIQVGFLVDSVDSIVTFFEEDILAIPMFQQEKIEMMSGLLPSQKGESIILLNESNILSHKEVIDITHGHSTLYGKKDDQAKESQKKASERKAYLSFKLDYLLSTRLSSIDEIAKITEELVRPPGYPDYVVGMMKMRGEIVTIVDLRTYYGMKPAPEGVSSRILVVKGQKAKFGLLVDDVESINTVDESQKVPMPSLLGSDAVKTLQGAMKDIVEMVDPSGVKKTYMIFEVQEFLRKLEEKTN
ncbi:chemotaxis protein CheW [Bdellovibrio sp. HCB337]|uniref:chemotaxis protein CheW n=1 Tax=Bdellovibrio sp. HCB337 TaxID=3394358 RepID=UPI0039A5270E